MAEAMTVAGVAQRLADAAGTAPVAERGDHALNPGWHEPQSPGLPRTSAVLILLVQRPEGLSVLFTQRSARLRAHGGQVSFPGGRAEPSDPSPAATALREAQEEIGLDPAAATVLGTMPPYLTRTGFLVTPVVATAALPLELRPDPNEVAEIFEVPLDVLLAPGTLARYSTQVGGASRLFYGCVWQDRFIWGATAGMLVHLRETLTDAPPPEGPALSSRGLVLARQ